jgi:beta-lactamase class A
LHAVEQWSGRRRTLKAVRSAWYALVAAAVLVVAPPAVAAPWHPDVHAAKQYAQHRHGVISFAVRTQTRAWDWHGARTYPSASVLKAMLLVAYLNERGVRHRPLRRSEKALLRPMIRRSDNNAASTILGRVGTGRLRALARRAHMHRFTPVTPIWGNSRIDANDQARFFLRIDKLIPARHRRYAMYLLAHVIPSQRWGIGRVQPRGWKLYFKGGWGSGTGRVDHQVALLTRGSERVSLAILTLADGTHAYGKETLRGVAKRLLFGLAASAPPSPSRQRSSSASH